MEYIKSCFNTDNNIHKFDKYYIINECVIFFNDFNNSLENYTNIISKYNKLSFSGYYYPSYTDTIFNNSQYLMMSNFDKSVDNLPSNLTLIILGDGFNKSVDNLPYSLTHLQLGFWFNKTVDNLPCSLTHLTLGKQFNQFVDNLPCSLTYLVLGEQFVKSIDNLPCSLTHLTLNSFFDQNLNNINSNIIMLTLQYIPTISKMNNLSEKLTLNIKKTSTYTSMNELEKLKSLTKVAFIKKNNFLFVLFTGIFFQLYILFLIIYNKYSFDKNIFFGAIPSAIFKSIAIFFVGFVMSFFFVIIIKEQERLNDKINYPIIIIAKNLYVEIYIKIFNFIRFFNNFIKLNI